MGFIHTQLTSSWEVEQDVSDCGLSSGTAARPVLLGSGTKLLLVPSSPTNRVPVPTAKKITLQCLDREYPRHLRAT